jgi:hypothetical protein
MSRREIEFEIKTLQGAIDAPAQGVVVEPFDVDLVIIRNTTLDFLDLNAFKAAFADYDLRTRRNSKALITIYKSQLNYHGTTSSIAQGGDKRDRHGEDRELLNWFVAGVFKFIRTPNDGIPDEMLALPMNKQPNDIYLLSRLFYEQPCMGRPDYAVAIGGYGDMSFVDFGVAWLTPRYYMENVERSSYRERTKYWTLKEVKAGDGAASPQQLLFQPKTEPASPLIQPTELAGGQERLLEYETKHTFGFYRSSGHRPVLRLKVTFMVVKNATLGLKDIYSFGRAMMDGDLMRVPPDDANIVIFKSRPNNFGESYTAVYGKPYHDANGYSRSLLDYFYQGSFEFDQKLENGFTEEMLAIPSNRPMAHGAHWMLYYQPYPEEPENAKTIGTTMNDILTYSTLDWLNNEYFAENLRSAEINKTVANWDVVEVDSGQSPPVPRAIVIRKKTKRSRATETASMGKPYVPSEVSLIYGSDSEPYSGGGFASGSEERRAKLERWD